MKYFLCYVDGTEISPRKTRVAGPVRVTSENDDSPTRVYATVRVSPPAHSTLMGLVAPVSAACSRADAVIPVPQARVSPSTPRS